MTIVSATTTLAPTCEARVGFHAGEYGELPLWCSARIGLTVWTDIHGITRRACRHHVEAMKLRWPEERERVARVIHEASAPLREFVVEDHGAYVVTVDIEADPPEHNHRSPFDAPTTEGICARCDYEIERAEG